jgi:hypothetical protein
MARKRSTRSTSSAPKPEAAAYSLDPLREKVEKTRQFADWMGAAFDHRDEFPPAVVITVVGDYLRQYDEMVEELRTEATASSAERKRLGDLASGMEDAARELEAQIDELKLRHVIGELTKDEFDAKEAEARTSSETEELPRTRDAIEEIDSVLAEVGSVQARIAEMRRNHEALASGDEPPPAAEEPPPAAPEPEAPAPEPEPGPDDLGDAAYAAGGTNEEWDVAESGSAPPVPEPTPAAADAVEETLQEPAQAPAPEPSPIASTGEDDLMATGVISARPDIADAPPPVQGAEQIAAAPGEGPRLMVTPPDGEEQMYPFTGEVMSMGRGRNNDIQIKNDGKISRYHCRIFRRGDEFIIEDNKSSNGTLVNGKLVTRQRLDGGEHVQIGETRMTFHL